MTEEEQETPRREKEKLQLQLMKSTLLENVKGVLLFLEPTALQLEKTRPTRLAGPTIRTFLGKKCDHLGSLSTS